MILSYSQIRESENNDKLKLEFKTKEEMISKAKTGFFVRDPEANIVYCPAGETLRKVSIKHNGNICYRNRHICSNCKYKNRCLSPPSDFKDITFNKDKLIKNTKWFDKENPKAEANDHKWKKVVKIIDRVHFTFKTDKEKLAQRFCLSEHPFGTIKRIMNGTYFLLRGKEKVNAEFSLLSLGYNLQRT